MPTMRSVFLIFMSCVLVGCNQRSDIKHAQFSGTVEITEHVLGFKSAGRIESMLIKEGDMVVKGQQLATLDRYNQSKKDYERSKSLMLAGGSSAQEVEYAALAFEDQQILSPVDGIILLKTVEARESVGSGAGVIVVGNPQEQWIKIFVPEGNVNQLKLKDPVVISFDGIKKKYQGFVSFISMKAEFTPRNIQTPEERITQVFAVKITFDNPDITIHPGVWADVTFQ